MKLYMLLSEIYSGLSYIAEVTGVLTWLCIAIRGACDLSQRLNLRFDISWEKLRREDVEPRYLDRSCSVAGG